MPRCRAIVKKLKVTKGGSGLVKLGYQLGQLSTKPPKPKKTNWFYLWTPSSESAFDRITFSMWLSILQNALKNQWGIYVNYKKYPNSNNYYITEIEVPAQLQRKVLEPEKYIPRLIDALENITSG